MTSPVPVQTKSNGATVNDTQITVVLDSAPTNNNLLLAVVHHHADEDAAISGWTARARSSNSVNSATQVFSLIANATSATIQATWTTTGRGEIAVVEISGTDLTTPLEVVIATLDATSPFTSTNATPSGGDKLLVGLVGAEGATTPSLPVSTGTGTGTSTLQGAASSSGASGGGAGIYTCPVTAASGSYTTQLSGGSNGSMWAVIVQPPPSNLPPGVNGGLLQNTLQQNIAWYGRRASQQYQRAINAGLEIHSDLNLLELVGQDQFYGAPGQVPTEPFPLPPRGRPIPVANKTFLLDLLPTTLFGQDQMYSGPGQVPAYNWQLPTKARPQPLENKTYVESLTNTTLNLQDIMYRGPGQAATYDWQLPTKARPQPVANKIFVLNLNTMQLAPFAMYGDAGQSPTRDIAPRVPPRLHPIDLRTYIQSNALTTLYGQDIFFGAGGQTLNRIDAPAAPARPHPIHNKTFVLNLLETTLLAQDIIYGDPGQVSNRIDAPRAPGRVYSYAGYILSLNIPLMVPIPLPPGQQIFPNTMRGRVGINPTFYNHLINLTLRNQDIMYGAPGEVPGSIWPGMRGYQRGIALLTWISYIIPEDEIHTGITEILMGLRQDDGEEISIGYREDLDLIIIGRH